MHYTKSRFTFVRPTLLVGAPFFRFFNSVFFLSISLLTLTTAKSLGRPPRSLDCLARSLSTGRARTHTFSRVLFVWLSLLFDEHVRRVRDLVGRRPPRLAVSRLLCLSCILLLVI